MSRPHFAEITPPSLKDSDPMPFGKFKGQPMEDVPTRYLFWLWTPGGLEQDKYNPVAGYIRANIAALELERKDGIWRTK
jgi:hypothetical protein